jgi:CDP-diglyceride synthetase
MIAESQPPVAAELAHVGPQASGGVVHAVPMPLQWSYVFRTCAASALLAAMAMLLGLTFPAAVLGGGFVSVLLYRRRTPGKMKPAKGAQLGAITGAFCFVLVAIFGAAAASSPDFRAKLHTQIIEAAQKWASARPSDPQVQAALDQLKTPEGLTMMLIIGVLVFSVIFVVLASLGGMLGAMLTRSDRS